MESNIQRLQGLDDIPGDELRERWWMEGGLEGQVDDSKFGVCIHCGSVKGGAEENDISQSAFFT